MRAAERRQGPQNLLPEDLILPHDFPVLVNAVVVEKFLGIHESKARHIGYEGQHRYRLPQPWHHGTRKADFEVASGVRKGQIDFLLWTGMVHMTV